MNTSFKEYMKRRAAAEEHLTEGMSSKVALWLGLGGMGAGLVNIIIGLLTKNPHLLWTGTLAAGAAGRMFYAGSQSSQDQNENQTAAVADPTEAIASHPAVQREAAKLGISHERLVSIIEKVRSFVSRFGVR